MEICLRTRNVRMDTPRFIQKWSHNLRPHKAYIGKMAEQSESTYRQ